jgi:hypothetical protein
MKIAARFRVRTAPIPFTKQVHKCHGVVPLSEGVVQFNHLAAGGFRFIDDFAHGSTAGLGEHDAQVYGFKGMDKESEHELEEDTRINRGEKAAAEIQSAYERGGRRAVPQRQLNILKTRNRKQQVSRWDLAEAYAALGMKDETLQQLEEAYLEHSGYLVFLQTSPSSTSCIPTSVIVHS